MLFDAPAIPAILADGAALDYVLRFVALRSKELNDKSGNREEQPLERNPIPAEADPPDD